MIDTDQDTSDPNDSRAVTIFVGTAQKFPERLLNVFRAELTDAQFVRVDTLADVAQWRGAAGGISLVVLTEDLAPLLLDGSSLISDTLGHIPIALGYSDDAVARGVLAGLRSKNSAVNAVGFLPLSVQMEVWLSVMRLLHCNEVFYPQSLLEALEVKVDPPAAVLTPSSALTPREREVLELVSLGKQNKAIAAEMELSEHTVKLHLHNVLQKLGVSNRTAAANWFVASGHSVPT